MFLEVMDKEPSILSFWVSGLVWGGLGFLLARRRWWWSTPVVVIFAASALGVWSEWTDPFVGPAIAEEAGRLYFYHFVASALLASGLIIAGAVVGRRRAA